MGSALCRDAAEAHVYLRTFLMDCVMVQELKLPSKMEASGLGTGRIGGAKWLASPDSTLRTQDVGWRHSSYQRMTICEDNVMGE